MKRIMLVAAAVCVFAGCQMCEEKLPENCVVIEEVKPAEPGRVVIDTTMVVHDYPFVINAIYCGLIKDESGCFGEVKKSEVVANDSDPDREWKYYFAYASGCTWPVGSSCRYIRAIGKLRIRNTEENHELIRKFLEECADDPVMIELRARFVKVGQETLDAIGEVRFPGKEKGHRYDISEFKSIPAGELEQLLVARRDLIGNEMSEVSTKPGEEAVVKSVTEYIYPTDYDVQMGEMQLCGSNETAKVRSCGIATVEPQLFTMREVGTILDVTPTLSGDGRVMDLKINTLVVDKPEWNEYGMDAPSPNGGSYRLPMKQPFFHVRSIDSKVSITPGSTVVMGGLITEARKAMDDKIPFLGDLPFVGRLFRSHAEQTIKRNLLIFVTGRLITPSGRELTLNEEVPEATAEVKAAPKAE